MTLRDLKCIMSRCKLHGVSRRRDVSLSSEKKFDVVSENEDDRKQDESVEHSEHSDQDDSLPEDGDDVRTHEHEWEHAENRGESGLHDWPRNTTERAQETVSSFCIAVRPPELLLK